MVDITGAREVREWCAMQELEWKGNEGQYRG